MLFRHEEVTRGPQLRSQAGMTGDASMIRTMTPVQRAVQGLGIAADGLSGASRSLSDAAKSLHKGNTARMVEQLGAARGSTHHAAVWADDAAASGSRLPDAAYTTHNRIFRGLEQLGDSASALRVRALGIDDASAQIANEARAANASIATLLDRPAHVNPVELMSLADQLRTAAASASRQLGRVG